MKGVDKIKNSKQVLRKLALGSVTDAVRLLLCSDSLSGSELEKMDLLCVSAMKSSGGKICEIKFCDRLKALQMLSEVESEKGNAVSDFTQALKAGAEKLE